MDDGTLERTCPYCNQTGRVKNPKFIEWELDNFIGKQPEEVFIPCPICEGVGLIPTPAGFSILDFIDKYNTGGNA